MKTILGAELSLHPQWFIVDATTATDYQVFTDRALFVVRWRNPTSKAARALTPAIQAHRSSVGKPVFFAILIGPDCAPPSPEAREVMLREHDQIHELTQAVRTVIIGGTARQTIMRSVMTAMTLAAGLRGKPFKVDRTVQDLAKVVAQTLGGDTDALLEKMLASGIVSATDLGQA